MTLKNNNNNKNSVQVNVNLCLAFVLLSRQLEVFFISGGTKTRSGVKRGAAHCRPCLRRRQNSKAKQRGKNGKLFHSRASCRRVALGFLLSPPTLKCRSSDESNTPCRNSDDFDSHTQKKTRLLLFFFRQISHEAAIIFFLDCCASLKTIPTLLIICVIPKTTTATLLRAGEW